VTLLAGLDVGTSAVKGLLITDEGEVVARAEAPHPLSTPRPGWAEQDPEEWWKGAHAVLSRLGAAGEIAGIGLTGQMHGLVALDAGCRVLRPAILWNDGRTGAECAEIERRVGLGALIAQTGNRALPGFTAPKLLWLARHEPEIHAQIAHVLLPKDYVRLRLTGELATDVSDASGTLLFDVARRRWSDPVLEALDVDPAWLPRALESPEVSGVTDATAGGGLGGTAAGRRGDAQAWSGGVPFAAGAADQAARRRAWRDGAAGAGDQAAGRRAARAWRDGIPVAAGAGDQAAGALGVGVDRRPPAPASVVLGTSGVVFAAADAFAADPHARVHTFCHAVPGAWHAMGVMLSAAGSLRWLRDAVAPGEDFATLVREAEAWPPGVEGLTFLPYLAGERTPHANPDARGAFVGLSLRHDRGALVRAVLEGVAFGLRDGLDLVSQACGRPSLGRVSGGGARSELWLRILASVLELPLQRMAVDEGAPFGAALLGGVAAGVFGDVHEAVAACVRTGEIVEPVADWSSRTAGRASDSPRCTPRCTSDGHASPAGRDRASRPCVETAREERDEALEHAQRATARRATYVMCITQSATSMPANRSRRTQAPRPREVRHVQPLSDPVAAPARRRHDDDGPGEPRPWPSDAGAGS
jgi:xylulokinase